MIFDPYCNSEKVVIYNGLEIYNFQWPYEVNWAMMGVVIHTGADKDPSDKLGLAHFVEHMLSGSVDYKKINQFFINNGGYIDLGSTSFASINYSCKIKNEIGLISQSMTYLADIIFRLLFCDSNFEKQKKLILSEFLSSYPNNTYLNNKLKEHKAIYSGTFLENTIYPIGKIDEIRNINLLDIQNFIWNNIIPSNISFVFIGKLPTDKLINLINQTTFSLGFCKEVKKTKPNISTTPLPVSNNLYQSTSKKVNFSSHFFYYSATSIPNSINYRTISIFQQMLNQKLFNLLREKLELTYSVFTLKSNYRLFSSIAIYSNSLHIRGLNKIDNLVYQCIQECLNNKEFEQFKINKINEFNFIELKGEDFLEKVMKDLKNYHRTFSFQEEIKMITELSFSDIEKLVKLLKNDRRWTYINIL